MNKDIAFVIQTAPYRDTTADETLAMLLACSSVTQNLALFFVGDGVELLAHPPPPSGRRDLFKVLRSLPLYDITALYACEDDCIERQIKLAPIDCKLKLLNPQALGTTMGNCKHVLWL